MKRVLSILVCITVTMVLMAETMIPEKTTPLRAQRAGIPSRTLRAAPEHSFIGAPVAIGPNYYDYMPGSYCSLPAQVNKTNGNIYFVYHAQEISGAERRVYYSFISNGQVGSPATINTTNMEEGYAGVAVDQITGDPLVSWHANFETSNPDLECPMSYDLFHLTGGAGLWMTPFEVIAPTSPSPNPGDQFIWPYVYIGPSPVADKQRVYVIARNKIASPVSGNPVENPLIAYADFDSMDLASQSTLNWSYTSIPELDNWHMGIPEATRPFLSVSVSQTDGTIVFFGHSTEDRMIAFVNTNYGEGEWEYYCSDTFNELYPVENPLNQDGTPKFDLNAGESLYWSVSNCHHFNSRMAGDAVVATGAMILAVYDTDGYYIDYVFPKAFRFDLTTHEFSFVDLVYTGANPDDAIPMVPWDLDEDGEPDEYSSQGFVLSELDWPIYYWEADAAFDDNNFKVTGNDTNDWLVGIWQDGFKARLGNDGEPGYADWIDVPEIYLVLSANNGADWSEPIVLNSRDYPELNGMIPSYVYPASYVEDLGNDHGKLHLFFLDDNEYGSSVRGYGSAVGGNMIYASLDISFEGLPSSTGVHNHGIVPPSKELLAQNYPNPFNPTTTVSFDLPQAGHVSIAVFNLRGQRIKTLVDADLPAQSHSVVWNGTDDDNNSVSSGVYFYKMITPTYTGTKKMILMK